MKPPARQYAFTLIELLALIAVLTIWSCILVPRLAKAHSTASVFGAQCLNNQRQLAAAALMYADDNNDCWLPNNVSQMPNWCGGSLDFSAGNSDNTNITLITNANWSFIAPFIQKPQIVHCPADQSYVVGEGRRVRSVSMNGSVGTLLTASSFCGLPAGGPVNALWLNGEALPEFSCQTNWRTYGRTWQMTAPTPANLWIFTDEHPESINDGTFEVQMVTSGAHGILLDFPASYHNSACGFSFADGHAELHSWLGQTIQNLIVPPSGDGNVGHQPFQAADSASDLTWLQQHTSAHY